MNAPAPVVWTEYRDDRPVRRKLLHKIEQFYYREARLLDSRRPREWLEKMVDKEIFYWLPVVEDRYLKDRRPGPTPDDPAIYADNYDDLSHRVDRLETGLVWMEDPPSRRRYLLSNIEAYHTDEDDLFLCYVNFHLFRSRRQRDESNLVGGREDLLRRDRKGSFRLLRRKVMLDHRVVLDKNLYVFF